MPTGGHRRGWDVALVLLAALLLPLLLTACGRPAVEAHPPLFRVRDGDTTLWLLGTMHLLPPEVAWRDAAVSRAIDGADALVVESAPDDAVDFATLATARGVPPLAARVPPGDRAALDRAMAAAGLKPGALDGQKTWAAATSLATGEAIAAGASPADGVEAGLWRAFAGRSRSAFHRASEQVRQLDALPPSLQDALLAQALDPRGGYRPTLAAWARGDLTALDPMRDGTPLAARLVGEPNRRWANWIAARMRAPGTVLVAVGAGHLAGRYALQEMLRARGYGVERVR